MLAVYKAEVRYKDELVGEIQLLNTNLRPQFTFIEFTTAISFESWDVLREDIIFLSHGLNDFGDCIWAESQFGVVIKTPD